MAYRLNTFAMEYSFRSPTAVVDSGPHIKGK
jgi:hypothetical protein